jgi:hypothetical protein
MLVFVPRDRHPEGHAMVAPERTGRPHGDLEPAEVMSALEQYGTWPGRSERLWRNRDIRPSRARTQSPCPPWPSHVMPDIVPTLVENAGMEQILDVAGRPSAGFLK